MLPFWIICRAFSIEPTDQIWRTDCPHLLTFRHLCQNQKFCLKGHFIQRSNVTFEMLKKCYLDPVFAFDFLNTWLSRNGRCDQIAINSHWPPMINNCRMLIWPIPPVLWIDQSLNLNWAWQIGHFWWSFCRTGR